MTNYTETNLTVATQMEAVLMPFGRFHHRQLTGDDITDENRSAEKRTLTSWPNHIKLGAGSYLGVDDVS